MFWAFFTSNDINYQGASIIDIWDLVIDFGIAGGVILACKFLRVNLAILQRLFIPVAMLAGLVGLALGANGLDILPMSELAPRYGGVLISVVFAAIGLSTSFPEVSTLFQRTGRMLAYNQIITISQWALALIIGLWVLPVFWPGLSAAFGLLMPAGFMGGHGTAVALGESLTKLGWEDSLSLALTSATFGVFLAVLGGMVIVNIGARLGLITHVTKFEDLARHVRRGQIPHENRESVGDETVAASSVNVFTLHLSLVGLVTVLAYLFANWTSSLSEFTTVPVFASAFLIGCLTRAILKKTGAMGNFDEKLFSGFGGAATDFLIFFGITSIQISVLIMNAAPFLLLMLAGVLLCLTLVFIVAPLVFRNDWFDKAVFSWGWMTGTVALGILLLRICDPKNESHVLDDYAIAYVPGSVVDILLLSFVPGFVMLGHGANVLLVLGAYLLLVSAIPWILNRAAASKA